MGNSKSEISDNSRDYAKTFFEQKLFQQEYFDEQELKYKRILRKTRTNELDLVYFLLSDFLLAARTFGRSSTGPNLINLLGAYYAAITCWSQAPKQGSKCFIRLSPD